MRLLFEEKKVDPEKLMKLAETRIGGEKGKRAGQINGFWGTFGFGVEDVWLSDPVDEAAGNICFLKELLDIIPRFRKDDYGLYVCPMKIWVSNVDERYFGTGSRLLGLYETSLGNVYLYMDRDVGKTVYYFQIDPAAEEILLKEYGECIYEHAESSAQKSEK